MFSDKTLLYFLVMGIALVLVASLMDALLAK